MTKLTKKEALTIAINAIQTAGVGVSEFPADEVVSKLTAMIESLERKPSGERKPTKVQVENAGIKNGVLDWMECNEPATVGDMVKAGAFPEGVSPQKATALMTQLVKAGQVVRVNGKTGEVLDAGAKAAKVVFRLA